MRPKALDDNAYAAFQCGDAHIVAVLQHAPSTIVSATVPGELLAGFAAGQRESAYRKELTRFISVSRVRVAPATQATADLYAASRRKRRPIPTNHLWIAARCLEHGASVLTFDAHFPHIDGFRLGQRLEDFIP